MAARTRRRRNPEGRMSLGDHLVELRKRLMWGALAIVVASIASGIWLYDPVWGALQSPVGHIAEARGANLATLNYTNITGAFDTRLQIAIVTGIVLSSPVWLYQVFAFLVPGLTRREKRYTFGFVFSAIPLFFLGCAAGWFVLPHIVEVMYSFVPDDATTFFEVRYYLDFVLKLVLATGIAFALPVFLVLLNFIGILQGRTILKGWRWAVLAITLFAAIATPAADVISMFMLMVPMIVLYFAAVGIAILHDRRVAKKRAQLDADLDDDGLDGGAIAGTA